MSLFHPYPHEEPDLSTTSHCPAGTLRPRQGPMPTPHCQTRGSLHRWQPRLPRDPGPGLKSPLAQPEAQPPVPQPSNPLPVLCFPFSLGCNPLCPPAWALLAGNPFLGPPYPLASKDHCWCCLEPSWGKAPGSPGAEQVCLPQQMFFRRRPPDWLRAGWHARHIHLTSEGTAGGEGGGVDKQGSGRGALAPGPAPLGLGASNTGAAWPRKPRLGQTQPCADPSPHQRPRTGGAPRGDPGGCTAQPAPVTNSAGSRRLGNSPAGAGAGRGTQGAPARAPAPRVSPTWVSGWT